MFENKTSLCERPMCNILVGKQNATYFIFSSGVTMFVIAREQKSNLIGVFYNSYKSHVKILSKSIFIPISNKSTDK